MVRPNKIIVILQQCFVSIVMAFNGCQESSREKEVYDILKDAGILNPRICVAPDSGLFVYLPTDEYYNCSRLVGGFHDLERYKGECEWFDLKDLKCCTRLKSIDIGTGILLNIEEILRMPQLECVSGTLVEVPENMDVAGKLNALAGLLKIVLTKKNLPSVLRCDNKRRYFLVITSKVFSDLSDREKEALKRCDFGSINSSRPDVFWEKPEFNLNLQWEFKDYEAVVSDRIL